MLYHLIELRRRMWCLVVCFLLCFGVFFIYSSTLFHALIQPLLNVLPINAALIATHIASPVLIPIKLAMDAAILASMPLLLWHAWRFVTPGLYSSERQIFLMVLLVSFMLFASGMLFAFYLVLPMLFKLFAQSLPLDVQFMPDISSAVDFITKMLLVFGFCFQVPIACWLVVRLQWTDVQMLQKIRPYVIIGAFIIGMILTPPDVLSQLMLAIPLCLLYEIGILCAKHINRARSSNG